MRLFSRARMIADQRLVLAAVLRIIERETTDRRLDDIKRVRADHPDDVAWLDWGVCAN